jgi:hypothetical protein
MLSRLARIAGLAGALGCLLIASTSRAQGLFHTLKARVGAPVVPELMGGCSLRCAFGWTVEALPAGAAKAAPVYATNDDYAQSAWVDIAAQGSVGSRLVFKFPSHLYPEMEGTPFYGIQLINGRWLPDDGTDKPRKAWLAHARLKKLRLIYNGKPLFYIELLDTPRWQSVWFDDIPAHSGDTMTLEILDIYPGTESRDAAVSEIVLQGAH